MLVFVFRKLPWCGYHITASLSDHSLISSIISSVGGGRMSWCKGMLWPAAIGVWAPDVPSAHWWQWTTQIKIGMFDSIAACSNLAAELWLIILVTVWACGQPSLLGSSQLPQHCLNFWLGHASPVMAAITIDKIVASIHHPQTSAVRMAEYCIHTPSP